MPVTALKIAWSSGGERRDCVGDGPDCRADNRQDKREDRRDRAVDRVEDRGERMKKRF